jgi:hypothetical protein
MKNIKGDWETEFEERFGFTKNIVERYCVQPDHPLYENGKWDMYEQIKDFIHSQIKQAELRGYERGKKEGKNEPR